MKKEKKATIADGKDFITAIVTKEEKEKIKALAKSERYSTSSYLAKLIEQHLKEKEKG